MPKPSTGQAELFTICALCGGRTWHGRGRLCVTATPDGRAVLRLEDGTTHGGWLELLGDDMAWLIEVLRAALALRAGNDL